MPVVRCPVCHREEIWTPHGDQVEVTIVEPGGQRRTKDHPQWVRGRTALAAWAGETGPVVGVCEGCGQLLLSDDRAAAPMPVRIDTPEGPLEIVAGALIGGPTGPLGRPEADALLERQYRIPITRGLARDLARSLLFVALLGPFVVWLGAATFVWSFLASLYEGVPAAVSK